MAIDFKLYLITDRKQTKMPLQSAIRLALRGGVPAIQLRERDLPVRDLLTLAREIRIVTNEFGAKLFINDRVDVAVAVRADGVHVGHASMPPGAVKKIAGTKRMLIGVSTHSPEEASKAERDGADFITYGPIFRTPSKLKFGYPVGPKSIEEIKKIIHIPIFVLGGIKSGNIDQVMNLGADGIAMISEILAAEDIEGKSREIVALSGKTH